MPCDWIRNIENKILVIITSDVHSPRMLLCVLVYIS